MAVNIAGVDLLIVVLYLGAMLVFGSLLGKGVRSVSDYVVAGRDRPWWLILASIVATETSTVTFLSIPGFAFSRDLTWLQLPFGFLLGRIVVSAVLLPRYFEGSLISAYEVLEQRFGGATKRVASALFVVTRSLADGLRLFLTALVLQELAGIPIHWAVVVLGMTTIAYTFLGGMRAVLWTDFVQLVIYIGGAIVALRVIVDRMPGGLDQVLMLGGEAGKLRIFDLSFDWSNPYVLVAGLVGGAFVSLASHGVDQLMVQRYLCARSLSDARRAVVFGGVAVVFQFALFLFIGVALFSFYEVFPPVEAFERADRVFGSFILNELPVGLTGLLVGAIFAAAMSTLSSSLSSCATVVANDLLSSSSKSRQLRATRLLTIVFGIVQIGVGVGGQWVMKSVVESVLSIAGFTTGLVLGVFLLGISTRRVGQRAALTGLLVGLAGMIWVSFATSLAWPWYALAGSTMTYTAGLCASMVWRESTPLSISDSEKPDSPPP